MYESFFEELKRIREQKNISLKALADASGTNSMLIKRLESGEIKNPRREKLGMVAKGVAKLLSGDPDKFPEDINCPSIQSIHSWSLNQPIEVEISSFDNAGKITKQTTYEADYTGAKELLMKHLESFPQKFSNENLDKPLTELFIYIYECTKFNSKIDLSDFIRLIKAYSALPDGHRELLVEFSEMLQNRSWRADRRKFDLRNR